MALKKDHDYSVPIYETRLIKVGKIPVTRVELDSDEDAARFCLSYLEGRSRETVIVILLDPYNRILGVEQVAQGTPWGTTVWVPSIVGPAILSGATGVIVCHNHVLGKASDASEQDLDMTKQIEAALNMFYIKFIDHIIIDTDGNTKSLKFMLMNEDLFMKLKAAQGASKK